MVSELSILIPVYNVDITELVKELHHQCTSLQLTFEIRCYDDFSLPFYIQVNSQITDLAQVIFKILPANIGRSNIRNKLAQEALFEYILLLDNDSVVISRSFIQEYIQNAGKAQVLIGGTCYQDKKPARPYQLHWHYGRKREQRMASIRNRNPYQSFHINNIFLPKYLYLKYPLTNLPEEYGHEDSLFGQQLKAAGVAVLHLDNPVMHTGLEKVEIYLIKIQKAVYNLHHLYVKNGFGKKTKIIAAFEFLLKTGLLSIFITFMNAWVKFINARFSSGSPNLWLLDLYKLHLFAALYKSNKKKPS